MESYPLYSVAIRTIGKAGNMFVRLVNSLKAQTVPPVAVYVYLAEGAPQPDRIADEIYIQCKRGMVAQRSLPLKEITTPYVLFSDDDMYLPEDAIEKMFDAIMRGHYDAISCCLFSNHLLSLRMRIIHFLLYGEYPATHTRWAYKIRNNSFYSYALHPREVMDTQSFPGGCFLIKKDRYISIHFEDERWIDSFQYALGDDQLFSYKLYRYGVNVGIHFNTGILHLDAQSGRIADPCLSDRNQLICRLIVWYRSIYEPDKQMGRAKAVVDVMALGIRLLWLWCTAVLLSVLGKDSWPGNVFDAVRLAHKEINSEPFKKIPQWKVVR